VASDQLQLPAVAAPGNKPAPVKPPPQASPKPAEAPPEFEAMQSRGVSSPLLRPPTRTAVVTTNERLRVPDNYGNLQGSTLSGILAQLDKGQPEFWSELVQFALTTDDHLRSCYDTRITRVVQAEYQIVPNEFGNETQAALAAELVNEQLARVKQWRGFMRNALHAEALGFSCNEIMWARDAVSTQVYPETIRGVHPRRFRFDEQWVPRLYDRGQRRFTGKAGSTFQRYGEALNPSGWITHIGSGVGGYPNSAGYMRSGIWHWMFKRWVEGYYIGFIEKYGSGRAHGQVPKGATDEVRRKALAALENWANDGFAVLEEGSTIVIDDMSAATSSETAHAQYIGYIERVHTKLVLGTSDAADPGQNGSQAAVGARTGATMDPRMVSDGLSLCDTLHDQLFYWICYFNRHLFDGGNMPPVPRMQFKTASDEAKTDVQDLAEQNAADGSQPGPSSSTQVQVPGALASALPGQQAGGAPQAHPGQAATPGVAPTPGQTQPAVMPGNGAPSASIPEAIAANGGKAADAAMNGAQVKSMMDIVAAAAANEIPRDAAVAIIKRAFMLDQAAADEVLGSVGKGFVPPTPDAQPGMPGIPGAGAPPTPSPQDNASPPAPPGAAATTDKPKAASALTEQDEIQMSAQQADLTPEEEDQIADVVASYRSGEKDFKSALDLLAETSLTWKEAQVLLADEDGAPSQMTTSFADAWAMKFNPSQPRDADGKFASGGGGGAVGQKAPINSAQRAKLEASLEPKRKAALEKLKAKVAAKGQGKAPQAKPPAAPAPDAQKAIAQPEPAKPAAPAPNAPQAAAKNPPAKVAPGVSEMADRLFGKKMSSEDLDELAGLKAQLPDGHTMEASLSKLSSKEIYVRGKIKNANGEEVGSFLRNISPDRAGGVRVYHEEFFLDDAAQNSGIGKHVFNSQIDAYQKHGISTVTLDADKVGKYVWSKAGFDWEKGTSERIRARLNDHLTKKFGKETAKKISATVKTPQDIASIVVGKERVGKDFLIGLDETIPGMHQSPAKIKRL
jgi:phage gp29-like protein/GNAT superfamily N-acetyltransferase